MRARNIKPGFFSNEQLADCSFPARILFEGLWCLADREGRLEDRPKKIKAEIFPYDALDPEPLIQELVAHGLIVRYKGNSKSCIFIPTFLKHQHPHLRESASVLPAYVPEEEPTKAMPDTCLGDVEPGGILNPDILNPESGIRKTGVPSQAVPLPENPGKCPTQKIIGLWHEILPELPKVKEWTEKREELLCACWKEKKERRTLDWWKKLFLSVRDSDFLMGHVPPKENYPQFVCRLTWLIEPDHLADVLERTKYFDDKKDATRKVKKKDVNIEDFRLEGGGSVYDGVEYERARRGLSRNGTKSRKTDD